jgi:uncharacterized membrane-anchored protein
VTLVAVALPLLAIVLGIVRAERFLRRTRDFVLEIGGYDPRDLLRGHYLQFTLRVDPLPQREACVDDPQGTCCLCLTRAQPGQVSQVERATCATAHTECDGSLPLGVLAQPYRYYVPEDSAKELQKRLLDAMPRSGARAVVAVDSRGEARVRELRIDGVLVPGAVPR